MKTLYLFLFLQVYCYVSIAVLGSESLNCTLFSSTDSETYWDAVSKCPDCNAMNGCGFCLSTLRCMEGTESGPSSDMPCPTWAFDQTACPIIPDCDIQGDCGSCAVTSGCTWCASQSRCATTSDAFSSDCRGMVFELPCPDTYVTDNIITGNLIVRAEPSFGGGQIDVSGNVYCT